MDGFQNLPCLSVNISSQGLNGTVLKGNYGDFNIQSNNCEPRTFHHNVQIGVDPGSMVYHVLRERYL